MLSYLKLLIVMTTVGMTQFAHSALLHGADPQQPDRLNEYFSHYDKEIDFLRKCFIPTVIKTGESDYINNYTSCLVDGLAHDVIDGKHGYVDEYGQVIIPHQFKSASSFSDGLARVAIDVENDDSIFGRHIGYIDKKGSFVVEPIYIFGQDYSEGLIGVLNKEYKYGFIDKHGNTILPFIYDYPIDYDSSGLITMNMIYSSYSYIFHDGVALVSLNGQWQFIDKQGNTVEYISH